MIYVLASVLIALVFITFIAPVLRQRSTMVSHADSAQAIMHDQLDEVGRDVARGLISAVDGQSARVEIQRRIIAVENEQGQFVIAEWTGAWVMIGAGVSVPVAAAVLYLVIGSPSIPSAIFSERGNERAAVVDQTNQTQQLLSKLEMAEDGGATQDWLTLANAYLQTGDYKDAADAFSRVLERKDATHAEFNGFAEAIILSENGIVTPIAEAALDRSLQMAPANISGTFYKSFALEQAGKVDAAYALLTSRLRTADGRSPWTEAFVARANHYGKKLGRAPITLSGDRAAIRGPTAVDVAAASEMSAEERTTFIASMVERLAARLETEPDDLDGWLQLARAYSVLGDETQAFASYREAERLALVVSGTATVDHQDLLNSTAVNISGNVDIIHIGAGGFVRIELFDRRLTGETELLFTIADGWHINAHVPLDDYLIPTSLSIDDESSLIDYPEPVIKSLTFNDAPLALYEDTFSIHATRPKGLNRRPTKARLTFQACSYELCLPPEDMVFVHW